MDLSKRHVSLLCLSLFLCFLSLKVQAMSWTDPVKKANTDKCFRILYQGSYNSASAIYNCKKYYSDFQFIANPNFDQCLNDMQDSSYAGHALSFCVKANKRFLFVNNPNYQSCLYYYRQVYKNQDAVGLCSHIAATYTFYGNENFDKCFSLYKKHQYEDGALNTCLEISQHYRFVANDNFDRCYTAYVQFYSSHLSANICMDKSRSFNFVDSNRFERCLKKVNDVEDLDSCTQSKSNVVIMDDYKPAQMSHLNNLSPLPFNSANKTELCSYVSLYQIDATEESLLRRDLEVYLTRFYEELEDFSSLNCKESKSLQAYDEQVLIKIRDELKVYY